jgi:hypothetical protein
MDFHFNETKSDLDDSERQFCGLYSSGGLILRIYVLRAATCDLGNISTFA